MPNLHAISGQSEPAVAPPAEAPAEPEPEPIEVVEQDESEPETPPEPEGLEVDEDAEYMVDGEKVSGKDLLAGRMMRDDYTRKTQELAEQRKQFSERLESLEDERDDVVSWAESLSNPARMEVELATNFPEAFEALKERIIENALREAELEGKAELQYYRDARKAELEAEARKAQEESGKRTGERKARREEVARMRTEFSGWRKTAMEQAGLNPGSAAHLEAVNDRMIAAHKGQKWTAETFSTAAKHVAKLVGAKAPEPQVEEPEKPVVPKVLPSGAKPKPKVSVEAKAAAAKAARPQTFDQLRKKFGAF